MNIITVGQYEAHYTLEKGSCGARDSLGVPLEPDEPVSIYIEKVLDCNGVDVFDELTTPELIEIEASCLNHEYQNL